MGIGALISMGIGLLGAHALVYLVSLAAIAAMAVLLTGRRRITQVIETHEHDQEVVLLE